MWLFHKLLCHNFVISSVSSLEGFPSTLINIISVRPFLVNFNRFSGLVMSIWNISHIIWQSSRQCTVTAKGLSKENSVLLILTYCGSELNKRSPHDMSMQTQMRGGGTAATLMQQGTRRGWVVSTMLYHWERPGTHCMWIYFNNIKIWQGGNK